MSKRPRTPDPVVRAIAVLVEDRLREAVLALEGEDADEDEVLQRETESLMAELADQFQLELGGESPPMLAFAEACAEAWELLEAKRLTAAPPWSRPSMAARARRVQEAVDEEVDSRMAEIASDLAEEIERGGAPVESDAHESGLESGLSSSEDSAEEEWSEEEGGEEGGEEGREEEDGEESGSESPAE